MNKKDKSDNLYWSSQFRNLLKFTKDEAKLVPQARTSFTKPRSLGQYLNTFSSIAKTTKAERRSLAKNAINVHYVDTIINIIPEPMIALLYPT